MADFVDAFPVTAAEGGGSPAPSSPAPAFIDAFAPPPPAPVAAPSRWAPAEIGTAALRGVLAGAPETVGKGLQFAGANQLGGAVRGFGEGMAQQPWLQPTGGHNWLTNAFSQAAEGIGTYAPAIGAAALAGTVGLPETIATGVGAVAGGLLGGGAAGQEELEKQQAKGASPEVASIASKLNAAQSFFFNAATGGIEGKLLGKVQGPIGRVLGMEGPAQAEGILSQLSGTDGVLKPFLKQLPISAAGATTAMMGQAGVQAGIEQATGVDDTSPWQAMAQQIGPSLALTALMTPAAIATRHFGVRSAVDRTATLSSPETPPEIRTQLADQYAAALSKADPVKAAAFRANAETAIASKQGLPVDSKLFEPGAIQPPAPPEAPIPLLPNAPTPRLGEGPPGTLYTMPDGSVATFDQAIEHIESLPPEQQNAVRAQVFGLDELPGRAPLTPSATPEAAQAVSDSVDSLHAQIQAELRQAGVEPSAVITRQQFAEANGLGGLKGVLAYRDYLNSDAGKAEATQVMHENIAKWEQLQQDKAAAAQAAAEADTAARKAGVPPSTESSAPKEPEPVNTLMADQLKSAARQRDFDRAQAALAQQKAAQNDAIVARTRGEQEAAAAQAAYASHAQELETLHGQVNDALRANGIEPTPVTSEDPDHLDSVIRANADKYTQMVSDQEAARKAGEAQPPGSLESSAPQQFNTQLAEKLRAANEQRKRDLDFQKAEADVAARKQAETDAIANRVSGERLAARVEDEEGTRASTVQPDENAPKTVEHITSDADAIKQDADGVSGSAMRSFDKRVANLKLDQMGTHQEQIDALKAAADKNGMSIDVATMMKNLAGKWEAEQPQTATKEAAPTPAPAPSRPKLNAEQPAGAKAALGENIPKPTIDNTLPPPNLDAVTESMPGGLKTDVRQQVKGVLDKLNAIGTAYNERKRAGETLTPEETEHHKTINMLRGTLDEIAKGGNNNTAYMRSMMDVARQNYEPGGSLEKTAGATSAQPTLRDQVAMGGKLSDVLAHVAENGSTPEMKALAQRLGDLGLNTTIHPAFLESRLAGRYSPSLDRIEMNAGHESEESVLHEATHAGLMSTIERGNAIDIPRNQREAQLKQAVRDLEDVRQKALGSATPQDHYGLTNQQEFAAELMSNPKFQDFLKSQGTQKSLWQRAVDAVRRMFGMSTDERGALEKAMDAANVVFDEAKAYRQFNDSPQGAVKVADETLNKFVGAAEALGNKVNLETADQRLYKFFLGFKTVDFMADRLRAMPEMVKSGLAAGLDAYREARDALRVVGNRISEEGGRYGQGLQKIYGKLGNDAARRALDGQLGRLAGESSREGFDIRQNFNDNVAAGRDLNPQNKAYYDGLHREFTQLQKSNPEAAEALIAGQLGNRKMLNTRIATFARSVMASRAGMASPEEAALVAKYSPALDIEHPDVRNARNPNTKLFYDGASAALHQGLDGMFAAARALPELSPLRAHMAEVEQIYRAQAANPYFSLGRDGDYFVHVNFKDMDAATQAKLETVLHGTNKVLGNLLDPTNDHAYMRFDSAEQAQAIHDKMLAANPDKVVGTAWGKIADKGMINAHGVSPALRSMFADLDDMVDHTPGMNQDQALQMKQTLQRSLLSLLPETQARSAKMQRQGVAGYDGSFLQNYMKRASGAAQDTAQLYAAHAYSTALKQMGDAVERMNRAENGYSSDGRIKAQLTMDEINRHYANSMTKLDNPTVNLINSIGSTFYLAFSPAYMIRTTAQPMHRGWPLVGSKFGFAPAALEIGRGMADAGKVFYNTFKGGWQNDGMRGILNAQLKLGGFSAADTQYAMEMHDRGELKLGQMGQIAQLTADRSSTTQAVSRWSALFVQTTEMNARLGLGLAAFRLAEKRNPGTTPEKRMANIDYAQGVVRTAMDNFDTDNTARQTSKFGVVGKATPLISKFQNYNLQMMQTVARIVQDGFLNKDLSPEGKQRSFEAKKEGTALLASTAMLAGALGLPFANAFAGLYNTLTKDDNDPDDIRMSAQRFFANVLGQKGGEIASHGLGALIGMDTSSFGLENLLPGSEFLADRRTWADRASAQSEAMMGPALNAGIDLVSGMSKISNGYWGKGIETMLPTGLKAPYKAAELAGAIGPGGYTDSRGNPLPMSKPSGWDIALQTVGFRSSDRASESERQQYQSVNRDLLSQRRSVINDHLFKASGASGGGMDPDAFKSATDEMNAFNAANPTQPIRGVGESIRQHMMNFALGQASGLGMPITRRELPAAQKRMGFAAMPQGQ